MKIVTIVCWCVAALAIAGLVIWFLTGTSLLRNVGGRSFGLRLENLTGPFEAVGNYSVPADNLDSIKIDWVAGNITVNPFDGSDIQITEYARRTLSDNEKLYCGVSGRTLNIDFHEKRFNIINMPEKRLEVRIPRALCDNLESFTVDSTSGGVSVENMRSVTTKIETVSGAVNLSGIAARTLDIGSASGSITLKSVTADEIKASSVSGAMHFSETVIPIINCHSTSGRLELSGSFENVTLETVSGSIDLTSSAVPESLRAETTSGSITVKVPDEGSVSVKHSSVSGRFTSDIPVTMQGNGARFNFHTISGSVKIEVLG